MHTSSIRIGNLSDTASRNESRPCARDWALCECVPFANWYKWRTMWCTHWTLYEGTLLPIAGRSKWPLKCIYTAWLKLIRFLVCDTALHYLSSPSIQPKCIIMLSSYSVRACRISHSICTIVLTLLLYSNCQTMQGCIEKMPLLRDAYLYLQYSFFCTINLIFLRFRNNHSFAIRILYWGTNSGDCICMLS